MAKLVSLVLVLFLGIACALSQKQTQNSNSPSIGRSLGDDVDGCMCTNTSCRCCIIIPPPVKTALCLDTLWNATDKAITAKASFGGLNVGTAVFSKEQPSNCLSIFGGELCINAKHLDIIDTGSCGCWDVTVNLFGIKVQVEVGCFEFGYGSDCPVQDCANHSPDGCEKCDSQINCGWCSTTEQCMKGDQRGPFPGSGKCPSGWIYHKEQCEEE